MKAVCWQGTNKVQVETVPDPKIINPRDAIVKITSTAICGSDLRGVMRKAPVFQAGDISEWLNLFNRQP
jgi:threonine dehydrogenase-like Zn-dependent dehydrogenase